MRKMKITEAYGFTVESLRKEERKIKDAFFKQRLTVFVSLWKVIHLRKQPAFQEYIVNPCP
ncbi:hypothetical protein ABEV55_15825 [Aneurinibacillus thermoaerophilus]|uniref:hypothetical protein n=1 Tax=Aneurinibacillus thermoaerophilus TaxID=143495 RepID=UPI002E1F9317|nr:hypothetical protein [Aneurinibacillus thermoaerophilus]